MRQDRGRGQYICSKTGDEGSIYAARQGTRARNNNNMCKPSLHHLLDDAFQGMREVYMQQDRG